MDIARLKKLAGIGEEKFTTTQSIEQMMSQRYLERMRFSMNESKPNKLELTKLAYKTSDLAPVLSKDNVEYHYNVLSNGYVTRYNNKEGDTDFNYGGAMLHNLFWEQLQKADGSKPDGAIKDLIEDRFGDLNTMIDEMVKSAMTIQGSGWVYLNKTGLIKTTPNQSYKTDILMPIDMWEHSFTDYIPAKDAKAKYIKAMMTIIDWDQINMRIGK
tara:strand:- start:2630 stop:3271 length:642 start_codon:yes stop_codon:yes gene_type:complete